MAQSGEQLPIVRPIHQSSIDRLLACSSARSFRRETIDFLVVVVVVALTPDEPRQRLLGSSRAAGRCRARQQYDFFLNNINELPAPTYRVSAHTERINAKSGDVDERVQQSASLPALEPETADCCQTSVECKLAAAAASSAQKCCVWRPLLLPTIRFPPSSHCSFSLELFTASSARSERSARISDRWNPANSGAKRERSCLGSHQLR